MRLTRSVVRVLPQKHHPHFIERCVMECRKNFPCFREYNMLRPVLH